VVLISAPPLRRGLGHRWRNFSSWGAVGAEGLAAVPTNKAAMRYPFLQFRDADLTRGALDPTLSYEDLLPLLAFAYLVAPPTRCL
jgi:hypothetical protein